ncbi:MAG: UDP-glucose 4-epimerase GalE [Rhizobiales bacterium]|nr:UDP-glucose 4-epimerase GalE [Hyphomicrobiales bacterium]MBA69227.1 UDP-glucose 4-epimerase GalE [Hyphomicrobiales bacterium]|tara:strand:- start:10 stop:1044 length:1035 start_codon:yes stop_codon:yes gene_type:complete
MANILVTGGAGYIGAHTCVALMNAGHNPVILDNFHNSSPQVLDRLERITGQRPVLVQADIRDRLALDCALEAHRIDAVIHFAALKAVGESAEIPVDYYSVNIGGLLTLIEAMTSANIRKLVFSSSANVYGEPASVPVREDFPLSAGNPYGRTKLMGEMILGDLAATQTGWHIARLRYFNPLGAHESGLIGEAPNGIPSNIGPYVAKVAARELPEVSVFGDDYDTPDGTGVRDFIHVMDLAEGHIAALDGIWAAPGLTTVNLGTGKGCSVLELIHAFEAQSGRRIPYRIAPRRPADIAQSYADPSLAEKLLGWKASRSLADMCRDTWRWQMNSSAAGEEDRALTG